MHGLYAEPATLPPLGFAALTLAERTVKATNGKSR